MLSLELAEKLKSAWLAWEPQVGDCLSILYNRGCKSEYRKNKYLNENDIEEYEETHGEAWLPSLSQLLDEIKGLDWDVERMQVKGGKASILLHRTNGEHIDADWSPYFEAGITDDAVGEALLWILDGDKDA